MPEQPQISRLEFIIIIIVITFNITLLSVLPLSSLSQLPFSPAFYYEVLKNTASLFVYLQSLLYYLWFVWCNLTQNYFYVRLLIIIRIICCFVRVWNLVVDIAGRNEAEGVWEHGVEENIWT